MNRLIWAIAITISLMGVFLIPTQNVANAYNCSSSSSTHSGSASSSVSGSSGSCATLAISSSPTIGGSTHLKPPPPKSNVDSFGGGFSGSAGGFQSNCLAESATHSNGILNGGFPQGSCSAHSP